MDDDKQTSPQPEEPTTETTEETPQTDTTPPEPTQETPSFQPAAPVTPKKSKKKMLLVLLLVLVLGGGAAAWYFLKPKQTANNNNTETTQPAQEAEFPASSTHAYLFGDKIVAYNANTKKSETLVSGLPKYTELEDFYIDSSTWRVYYSQTGESSTKVFLAEKGKGPQQVLDVKDIFRVTANADKKIVVYMSFPTIFTDDKSSISRTFLLKDGQTKEIYTSDASNGSMAVNLADLKNALYNPREISADGTKVLFGRNTCYQCDGPPLASAFELDIATGKATLVHENKSNGGVSYAQPEKGGFIVYANKNNNLGPMEGPFVETVSHLKAAGGVPETIFSVSDNTWSNAVYDPDITQVAVDVRDVGYGETTNTKFDALYALKGAAVANLEKINIVGMPASTRVSELGKIKNGCQLISLTNMWKNNTTTQVVKVGISCRESETKFNYTELESKELPISEGYTTVNLAD